MTRRWSYLVLLLCASGLAAAENGVGPPPPDSFEIRGDTANGQAVFLKKCAMCHGENGDGQGRIKLEPPARDLRDGDRMNQRTDWQIYLVIRDGGQALGLSEKMLPWKKLLSEQELHDLTLFIRTLAAPSDAGEEAAAEALAEIEDGA